MSVTARIDQFFRRDLWSLDLNSLPPARRIGVRLLRLAAMAVFESRETALNFRATSLVYATLLSLVPFLAVAFSVLKAFGVHNQIEPLLVRALEPLGDGGTVVAHQVIAFVNNLKVGVLGAVGVAALFFTTLLLIDQIEQALNAVWRVRHSRPLARKFTDYLSVILVGPILIFLAFTLIASAQSYWLIQRALEIEPLGYLLVLATRFMPLVILCSAFTFLYKLVPHTQVRLSSALVGGVTAAILWQLAGTAFAAFVASSTQYTAIYSGLAILVFFLIWLYVGWVIVLIGAQVAYFHQHPSAYLSRVGWRRDSVAVRERLALIALIQMARRHLSGERPGPLSELALTLNVPLSILEDLVEDLIRAGIVYRSAEPEGIALGRPPEKVSAGEILNIIQNREPRPGGDVLGEESRIRDVIRLRDQAVSSALEGITLRTLAEAEPEKPKAP